MLIKTLLSASLAVALSISAAAAQTSPAAAPVVTTKPSAVAKPMPPAGSKTNLNTATAAELDALPQIGKARTKVIMDERAKSSFKDWADFDKRTQHTSVNAKVKAKIKDLVSF